MSRIRTLCRDLGRSVPGLTRVNRGKMSLYEVAEKAAELGAEKVVIIDRWKGGFAKIRLFKAEEGVTQIAPCIYIRSIRVQRELRGMRKPTSLLFMKGSDEGNREVRRLRESLSDFFGLPTLEVNEPPPKYGATMRLSVDSSGLLQISFYVLPENVEMGPRIIVSQVVWEI